MKRKKRISFWISIAVLIGAALFVCLPLMRSGFFISDDGNWMIIRFSAFYQSLREGQFPVRFLGRLNNGYGYPVANFLYPGFMYIGSLVHFAGFSFVDTVKIIFGGSIVVATIFTFLWLNTYFSSSASVMGTLGFTFAPYILYDLYHRGSVGEILAFAWAAMGLYSVATKKSWLFALAVSLLIVSHNTLALLFLGFYAGYISVFGQWRDFWLMFGLGIGMVTFFWFPALYEQKYVVFAASVIANPHEYFITLAHWSLVGLTGLIAALCSLGIGSAFKKDKVFFLSTFFFTLGVVLPISGFLWNIPVFARLIQFPYRFLSLTVFMSAWLIAYILVNLRKQAQLIMTCLFVGIGIWSVTSVIRTIDYTNEPDGYYTTNEGTTTVHDEYMPRWVGVKSTSHAQGRILFYSGQGKIEEKTVTTQTVDIVVHAAEQSMIEIHTVYYPGWGATLDDVQIPIQYKNEMGVIRVSVPQGDHHLVVSFRETVSRFLADNLSFGFLVWYVAAVIIKKRNA